MTKENPPISVSVSTTCDQHIITIIEKAKQENLVSQINTVKLKG